MKSALIKNIVKFLAGKLSGKEELDFINQKMIVSRMIKQWEHNEGDISGFDQQKNWDLIVSKTQRKKAHRMSYATILSAAASVLVLLGIGYLFWVAFPSGQNVRMMVYETKDRERIQLLLPDSTTVWLNAGSRIEYPEVFASGIREVRLNGEAYFDVTHRKNQPFHVLSQNLKIQVKGTRFVMHDYIDDSYAETALISGRVDVEILNDSNSQVVRLQPDELLHFDQTKQFTSVKEVNALQYANWIDGKLSFDNAELGQIINRLEHWYGKKIECPDELAVQYNFTLTVHGETLEQIVELLESAAPISFQPTDDGYMVVRNE